MEISSKKSNGICILNIKGRLDALTSTDFEEAICKLISEDERKIVLDLGGLDYISSAGLRAILFSAKRMKAMDGQLVFANITGMISEVFDISGFGTMFNIYGSALTAADKLSRQE